MESSGANGGQPGDSSNSELPCALQTLARPARIAWWRWSPQNLKGSERLAGGRAQRYRRKASEENIASWRDASPEVCLLSNETPATPDRGRDTAVWSPGGSTRASRNPRLMAGIPPGW